jgi:hypothetical protein
MANGLIIVTNTRPPPIAKLPRDKVDPELSTSESYHLRNKPGDEPDPLLHEGNRNILARTDNAIEGNFSAKI